MTANLVNKVKEKINYQRLQAARAASGQQILLMEKTIIEHAPERSGQPMILFNASTRISGMSLNAAYNLLTGWALRLQGVPVVQWTCRSGLNPCILGTNRDNPYAEPPCRDCLRQSGLIYPVSTSPSFQTRWMEPGQQPQLEQALRGLSVAELSAFEYEGIPLGKLVLPGLRWVLRRHHLTEDESTSYLFRKYLLSAYQTSNQFQRLVSEVQPRAVLVFNGQFYPEAAVRWIAQQNGVPVIAHEVGLQPMSAFFTPGEATAYPINIPPGYQLSPQQEERLDAYLAQRFQGNFSMAGIRFWPSIQPLSTEMETRLSNFRQMVPIFTNVVFDTSQSHANVLFEHMFAWLDQVLEIIRARPETLFILRAHPDEFRAGKASRETVAQWVQARHAADLPNLIFLDADEFISSYELIHRAKFVMIYNSTIGLEASILGAPVLSGGKARFTQLNTVFFPASAEDHRAQAEAFLSAEEIEIPAEFISNARLFLYYQLFRTSLPMGQYLQEEGFWRGFVTLKPFNWQDLLPENSPAIKAIIGGLVHGGDFLLEDQR